ncbi:YitT family protein [Mollicutes bacterium LVI A0039]|nr:YitT family protein [Mollicutes bacterium LVI A0039]
MNKLKTVLFLAIAIFLFSLSFNVFQTENGLVTGGVTGIVLVLNKLFAVPIPQATLIINTSFLILGFICLGKSFFFKTVLGSIVFYPLFLSIIPVFSVSDDMLVNALCGGAIMGIGISFLLVSGGSSGGTSLLSRILVKYTTVPFSIAIFIFDGLIITAGFLVFGVDRGVYALIFVITSTIISNYFETNYFKVQQVMVISSNDLREQLNEINLEVQMIFQSNSKEMSIFVIKQNQVKLIKQQIQAIDRDAQIIISDVTYHKLIN